MSHEALVLCCLDELVEGQARGFDPLRHDGEVRVYRNSCPHLEVRLEYRKDRFLSVDGRQIVCYAHGARFLPDSGLCVYGPCLGDSLSALQWHAEADWLVLEADQLEAYAS